MGIPSQQPRIGRVFGYGLGLGKNGSPTQNHLSELGGTGLKLAYLQCRQSDSSGQQNGIVVVNAQRGVGAVALNLEFAMIRAVLSLCAFTILMPTGSSAMCKDALIEVSFDEGLRRTYAKIEEKLQNGSSENVVVVIVYGESNAGKSTFLSGLQALLKDREHVKVHDSGGGTAPTRERLEITRELFEIFREDHEPANKLSIVYLVHVTRCKEDLPYDHFGTIEEDPTQALEEMLSVTGTISVGIYHPKFGWHPPQAELYDVVVRNGY